MINVALFIRRKRPISFFSIVQKKMISLVLKNVIHFLSISFVFSLGKIDRSVKSVFFHKFVRNSEKIVCSVKKDRLLKILFHKSFVQKKNFFSIAFEGF